MHSSMGLRVLELPLRSYRVYHPGTTSRYGRGGAVRSLTLPFRVVQLYVFTLLRDLLTADGGHGIPTDVGLPRH